MTVPVSFIGIVVAMVSNSRLIRSRKPVGCFRPFIKQFGNPGLTPG
jgi:hypothetical protein